MSAVEDLASWGDRMSQAIFPLFYTLDRVLFPIGTAFCFSNVGLVCSALHCVKQALRADRRFDNLFGPDGVPSKENVSLGRIGLAVLQHQAKEDGNHSMYVQSLHGANANPFTDVVYGQLVDHTRIPYPNVKLSFALPRVGSLVRCFGYHDVQPVLGMNFDALMDGTLRMADVYSHNFRCVTGKVIAIFVKEYAAGHLGSPCFLVDAPVEHGMSGGPVFDEAGSVCGIISMGAYDPRTGNPAALVSLLYPTLLTNIKLTMAFAQNFTMNVVQPLLLMIHNKAIRTDGSEGAVHIVPDEADPDILHASPLANPEDESWTFEDVHGYQAGAPAVPSQHPGFVYRRPTDDRGQ